MMDAKQRVKAQKFIEDPNAYSKVLTKAHELLAEAQRRDGTEGDGKSPSFFYEWRVPPWLVVGIDHHIRAIVTALRDPIPVGPNECLVKFLFGVTCVADHGVSELTLRRKLQ